MYLLLCSPPTGHGRTIVSTSLFQQGSKMSHSHLPFSSISHPLFNATSAFLGLVLPSPNSVLTSGLGLSLITNIHYLFFQLHYITLLKPKWGNILGNFRLLSSTLVIEKWGKKTQVTQSPPTSSQSPPNPSQSFPLTCTPYIPFSSLHSTLQILSNPFPRSSTPPFLLAYIRLGLAYLRGSFARFGWLRPRPNEWGDPHKAPFGAKKIAKNFNISRPVGYNRNASSRGSASINLANSKCLTKCHIVAFPSQKIGNRFWTLGKKEV